MEGNLQEQPSTSGQSSNSREVRWSISVESHVSADRQVASVLRMILAQANHHDLIPVPGQDLAHLRGCKLSHYWTVWWRAPQALNPHQVLRVNLKGKRNTKAMCGSIHQVPLSEEWEMTCRC